MSGDAASMNGERDSTLASDLARFSDCCCAGGGVGETPGAVLKGDAVPG